MGGFHSRKLSAIVAMALVLLLAAATLALAAPKLEVTGPTKGATYIGTLKATTLTVKVSASGKRATVGMRTAPAFCQGGSGAEQATTKPAAIAKKTHAFKAKLSYTSPPSHKVFATVTVNGTFYGKVLQGVVKLSFKKAKSCSGQESFEALAG